MTGEPRTGALVTPFPAERFHDLARLSEVLAPPYDVVGEEERCALERRSAYNIVHLTLPRGDEERYRAAAQRLARWRDQEIWIRQAPAVYAIRQECVTPEGRRAERTGVIAAVAAEPFAAGRVRPHERTHRGAKEDRLALLRSTRTALEALLMIAPDRDGRLGRALAAATAAPPWAEAQGAGGRVRVWQVTGAQGRELAELAGTGPLYIADGHHRYETAVAFRTEHPAADRVPALIVPAHDEGLIVLATHRVVHGTPIALDDLLRRLEGRFRIVDLSPERRVSSELARLGAEGTACVVVCPGGRALGLIALGGPSEAGSGSDDPVASLAVVRIDSHVVGAIRELAGPRAAVSYTSSVDDALGRVATGAAAAVLLNPTPLEDVFRVADAGAAMPPKSTYFVPKVPSGIVLMPYA